MQESDNTLLERWRTQRDAEAFRSLTERHARMVYTVCRRILGNAAEAEEMAQECFEVLAMTRRKAHRNSVGAWLHGVATKRSLQLLRSEGRRRKREQRFAEQQSPSREVVWDDIYDFVDEAIAALPVKLQAPLVAHYLEGQRKTDIARAVGVANTTISYRIDKGIGLIRKNLNKRGITVTAPALAALFASQPAEAVPPALAAKLGKLAVAGVDGASAMSGLAVGVALVLALFIVLGAAYVFKARPEEAIPIRASRVSPTPEGTAPLPLEENQSMPEAITLRTTLEKVLDAAVVEAAEQPQKVLHGIVVNHRGQPLKNVTVTRDRGGPVIALEDLSGSFTTTALLEGVTSADGKFSVNEIAPEGSRLSFYHLEYPNVWKVIQPAAFDGDDLRIVMSKGGTLMGKVTYDGQPVANQQVSVKAEYFYASRSRVTRTNERGFYIIGGIKAGNRMVHASLKASDIEKPIRKLVMKVLLENDKQTIANFEFPALDATLEGNVFFYDDPVKSARIHASYRSEEGTREEFSTSSEADGYYRLESLPAARLDVTVSVVTEGHYANFQGTTVDCEPGFTTFQDFYFRGTGIITGYCLNLDKFEKPQRTLYLYRDDFSKSQYAEDSFSVLESLDEVVAQSTILKDGTFRIEGVEAGDFHIMWQPGLDSFGNFTYAIQPVTVAAGQESQVVLGHDLITEDLSGIEQQ